MCVYLCVCVYLRARERKRILSSSAAAFSLSLIWSLYFSFIPTLCPWELEFHPSGVARDKSCLSSHHWVRNSSSPLIVFCVFNYLILRVITGHHPFFWKMTVSMTLLCFVQLRFLPRPSPLIFWCLAMPVFCPFWFLCLAQPSVCFLYVIISCLSPSELVNMVSFCFPYLLCGMYVPIAISSGRGVRSGSCWILWAFQFRRCICISPLPCFMSLCVSGITQAEPKLNSLKLHNAYPIKNWFGFPDEYEASICMGAKLKGLRRPGFYIFNNFPLYRDELSIYTLKDQIEAVAFCLFILSGETDDSKYIF